MNFVMNRLELLKFKGSYW